jgi:hypothetical protein
MAVHAVSWPHRMPAGSVEAGIPDGGRNSSAKCTNIIHSWWWWWWWVVLLLLVGVVMAMVVVVGVFRVLVARRVDGQPLRPHALMTAAESF